MTITPLPWGMDGGRLARMAVELNRLAILVLSRRFQPSRSLIPLAEFRFWVDVFNYTSLLSRNFKRVGYCVGRPIQLC
jgi:hypothetical protein